MTPADREAAAGNGPSVPGGGALAAIAALGSSVDSGLSSAQAAARLAREGPNEVAEQRARPLASFARRFWGLSAWMIELIVILSWILHKRADFWVALALLWVNALLGFLQEQRASAAVAALRRRLQVTSRVLRDATWRLAPARELVAGDVVRVRSGDFVPADVQLFDGELHVDQSALTGESQELSKGADDAVYAGSIVRQGEATGVVVATGIKTYFGRTAQLVQIARPKLHVEAVIAHVVKWLFVIVGVQVAAALVASLVAGLPLVEVLPLTLVLLMSAVPVALPVMFTVSMAVGSIELGRRGILITRLNAAEDAAGMDVLCADKTGTLTMNRLSLAGALPQPGYAEHDVIATGAWASSEADQDPIDLALLRAARERGLLGGEDRTLSFTPFSPQTRRTEALVERGGVRTRAMKGALRTVAGAAGLDESTIDALEATTGVEAGQGVRAFAVARAEGDSPWRFVGLVLLRDAPRPDSRRLIEELRSLGVDVKMLTGDALPVARAVAAELDLGEIVRAPELRAAEPAASARAAELAGAAGGFAEVFPEDKFVVVKSLQASGRIVGMTGDGLNDAPALRQAEVGIAVSGSTDVAKGAASVVLTGEGLANIVELVKNGRAIYQRVLTWILNKISRTILKSGFVVIAFLATGKFVISAFAMVLLVFMTDFLKISLAVDRVRPSPQPETWNIGPLVKIAVALGLLMLAQSLGLLAIGWHRFDLVHDAGRLHAFAFLTLLYFALFSLISIRERRAFWTSRPSGLLAAALIADGCAGAAIGVRGLGELAPLPLGQIGFIIAYASACTLTVNDAVKTVLIARYWEGRR